MWRCSAHSPSPPKGARGREALPLIGCIRGACDANSFMRNGVGHRSIFGGARAVAERFGEELPCVRHGGTPDDAHIVRARATLRVALPRLCRRIDLKRLADNTGGPGSSSGVRVHTHVVLGQRHCVDARFPCRRRALRVLFCRCRIYFFFLALRQHLSSPRTGPRVHSKRAHAPSTPSPTTHSLHPARTCATRNEGGQAERAM